MLEIRYTQQVQNAIPTAERDNRGQLARTKTQKQEKKKK